MRGREGVRRKRVVKGNCSAIRSCSGVVGPRSGKVPVTTWRPPRSRLEETLQRFARRTFVEGFHQRGCDITRPGVSVDAFQGG